jgi:cytochrome c oxidase subunit 2
MLEIIWTIFPVVILILIGVPSFSILYAMDELNDPEGTIIVVGHQWYWEYGFDTSYQLKNQNNVQQQYFDSFMILTEELNLGERRLLTVDNYLSIPKKTYFRIAITSSDVIHSFAIPGAGIKVDAIPGRLNQTAIFAQRTGTFIGQCSELCGVNHGFMPIVLKVIN